MVIYYINIDQGVITFRANSVTRSMKEYSANKYFAKDGIKPPTVRVMGWPFNKMYLVRGSDENGVAVAWA